MRVEEAIALPMQKLASNELPFSILPVSGKTEDAH